MHEPFAKSSDTEGRPDGTSQFGGLGSELEDDLDEVVIPHESLRALNNRLIYTLELIFGSTSSASIWRFPAIAVAMSVDWDTMKFGIFNFLVPYAIALVCIAWPLLVAELGLAQSVRGAAPKTFGSLSVRSRVGGMSFFGGILVALFVSAISAYSLVFMLESGQRAATYYSDRTRDRNCLFYDQWVPDVQPRFCFKNEARLEVSCFGDNDNCPLWLGVNGTGRCTAVPWGPTSTQLFESSYARFPWVLNDFPIYCGGRHFHDVTHSLGNAVVTREAYYSDFGGLNKLPRFKLALGFILTWVIVVVMSLMGPNLSSLGEKTLSCCVHSFSTHWDRNLFYGYIFVYFGSDNPLVYLGA